MPCDTSQVVTRGHLMIEIRGTVAAGQVPGSDLGGSDGKRFSTRNLGDSLFLLDFEEINMNNNTNNVQGQPLAGPSPQNHIGPSGPNLHMQAPDLRMMEDLCQPTINGRGETIASVNIQATDFELTNHMIQQERYKLSIDRCPNHNMLPITQIDTFYNGLTLRHHDTINVAAEGTFMKRRPEECYDLSENITAHHNDWDTSAHRGESSSSTTSYSSEIAALAQQMIEMRKDMIQMYRLNQKVNFVTPSYETCGGPHSYYECQATGGYTQDINATTGNYNLGEFQSKPSSKSVLHGRFIEEVIDPEPKPKKDQEAGALPSNTVPNPREQINSITTRSGLTTANPSISPPVPPTAREEVEHESETLMDEVHITIRASTAHVPALGIQPVSPPKPKEDPKPNPHQHKISYPSRLDKTKLLDKNDVQISNFLKMLNQLHFDISHIDALTQIPKYHKVLKDLLKDKEELEELENTLINVECSDDSRASINLMPLLIYEKLGIGSLKPTRMTLELANRSVALPKGIAQDVIVRVDIFNFLADFVVVDFEADPRVPIIVERPFLRIAKALVDQYEEKLTLRVMNEQVVFYTDKSLRNNSRDIQYTSDSLLEEFANELALLDPFPLGNKDDNFDPEADLREIEYLLNQDPLIDSSPTTDIDIIDLILENSPVNLLSFTHLYRLLDSDSTLPEESSELSEISNFLSSPFGNEDKVFNPGILILGGTQIFIDESKDKDFKVNTSSEAFLILEERNFLSISSDQEILFHLELSMTETLLSFSSENEDKIINPRIRISKGVHSFTLGLSHRTYETFNIINVHPNILNEGSMKIFSFFCFCPKDKGIRGELS
nr:hypothetical protein [Tanacetum cinerariifolium]